jgi:hypothetical protein
LAILTAAATTSGIQAVIPVDAIWVPVVAAAGGVAIASLLVVWRRTSIARLEVFECWFRYQQRDRTFIAHWGDVVKVYRAGSRRRRPLGRHEYLLVLGGGARLRIGAEIGADADLGEFIESRTRRAIASRAAAQLSNGIEVGFGPIVVGGDGVRVRTLRTETIPFGRISSQRITDRRYEFHTRDRRRPYAVPLCRVPSPGALHDLIDGCLAGSGRPPSRTGGGG